jgi:hypothetical protein
LTLQSQSIEAIAAGFPLDRDRYSLAECRIDPRASDLAARLEKQAMRLPPDWVKIRFREYVLRLYKDMPLTIYACAGEPYMNAEEMRRDAFDHKRMFVRHRQVCKVAGSDCQSWRAVHDYYGHVLQPGADFTLSGEERAFIRHTVQFPKFCWPYIWNNVVLENAYRLNRGHFLCYDKQCSSKIVHDTQEFGVQARFYDQF